MRAIADRIDYSPASLYGYFGGKDEIIAAVCDEAFE
jgi:AcrR family transcriptional regulator